MKQYKIFKHPGGASEAVKQGWSWPAFFFSSVWALTKRMWLLGGCCLVSLFVFGVGLGASGGGEDADLLINVVSIVINVIFGLNGNSWREKNLLSRGFEQVDTVSAANPEGAVALFLKAKSIRPYT